jgi:5-(carboxyamino)imidazole ribonucleotide synthase
MKSKNITLGIVGGGQLGRMLAEAAKKLGIKTIVLDPTPNSPAAQVADEQIIGDFKDGAKIKLLAKKSDFITFEIESANSKALKNLVNQDYKIQPDPKTLEVIQDKLSQKNFLLANNLPCAQFDQVSGRKDIEKAAEYLGYPLVLKARFHGYDGRGNAVIKSKIDISPALSKLKGKKLYVEKYIPFEKELAIQIVRNTKGKTVTFPLVETIQKNNICHIVKYPAQVSPKVEKQARQLSQKTVKALYGAGVFGIEMFLTKEDSVLINEIAPRVHNSGHWTIEGCTASQFEEHVRAVCNMPLKSARPKTKAAVMINILGKRSGPAKARGLEKIQKMPGVFVHIYGKFETRVERKMGHITVLGNNLQSCLKKAVIARSLISI